MADINLRIFAAVCKTHTKFPVGRKDRLIFHNESNQTLRITIDRADALLQHGKPIDLIRVDPKGSATFEINPDYDLNAEFKYTATIAGYETEDPIIIIEH